MSTASTKIRPRVRLTEQATDEIAQKHPSNPPVHGNQGKEMPKLPVLARIPELQAPAGGRAIPARLEWIRNLDWQRLGRIKADPNWVAGGVLGVVLLLLLVITFNRNSKNGTLNQSETEAPAWNAGKTAAPSPTRTPVQNAAVDVDRQTSLTVEQPTPGPVASVNPFAEHSSAVTAQSPPIAPAAEQVAVQSSLDAIVYPQTPYPAIGSPNGSAPAVGAAYHPRGEEIRTASRDGATSRPGQYQSGQPQYPARFDGIITKP